MAKTRRVYSGNATPATVPAGLAAAATSCTVSAATGWPGSGPFYAVISPGTSSEEKVLVGSISGTTLSSLTRGVDGTSDTTHAPGAAIYPVFTAVDADEANELTSKWTTKGDIVSHGATTFATVSVGTNSHVLQADSTVAAGIKWGQVANGGIADSAVTTAKIADDAVTAAKIVAGAVGVSELASNAVETAKIADDAVTQAKIGPAAVGTTELADDGVTAAKIATGAVGTGELADAGVTEAKLATSVAGSGLAGGGGSALSVNVDGTGIEINADTLRLATGGVLENNIALSSVTTDKIANGAVTADKLGGAVAGNGLAGGAGTALSVNVDNSTLEISTDSLRIKDGGVTFAKMVAGAPRGTVAVATSTTDSASIGTTTADLGLSVTFTAVSGRKYLVLTNINIRYTSGTNPIGVLYLTDGSNNQLATEAQTLIGALAIQVYNISTFSESYSGSTTIKVRGGTTTGTMIMDNSATSPSYLIVLDVGD